jgi:hypothetical protein
VPGKTIAVGTPPFTLICAVRFRSPVYVTASRVAPSFSASTPVIVRTPAPPIPVTRLPPEQRRQSTAWAPPAKVLVEASASCVVVPALALAATAIPATTVTTAMPPTMRTGLRMVIRIVWGVGGPAQTVTSFFDEGLLDPA